MNKLLQNFQAEMALKELKANKESLKLLGEYAKILFDSFKAAGFKDSQAIQLTTGILISTMNGGTNGNDSQGTNNDSTRQ